MAQPPSSGIDIEAAGLLDGLEGAARAERLELIACLIAGGFGVDQIRGALNPMLLPGNRLLGDDGTLASAKEVSDSSGVSVELLQQLHRAAGLPRVEDPDACVHSRADAESILGAAALVQMGIDASQVALIVRLLRLGLDRAAVTLRRSALQTLLRPGETELELATAAERMARDVRPLLEHMIDELFRLALRHQFDTEAISLSERLTGTLPAVHEVAVAFADLVDFTQLGEELPPEELWLVAGRFALLAQDLVVPPVQFVKTIGDAVMLASPEPAALLETLFDLIEEAAEDFPRLRVGVAYGAAASRGGDWYGSPVNLANRVTAAARPGEVLVAETVRHAIGDDERVVWSLRGARHLKGVPGRVRLWRVDRRPQR